MGTGTRIAFTSLAGILAMAAPALAAGSLLFVFDSSNSMWGQINGVAKIETARAVLGELVTELPAETRIGLMAYGHRSKDACDDIELVVPLGAGTAAEFVSRLNSLKPLGRTPIAGSLDRSASAFDGMDGDVRNIVVISDGVETCDGDPCMSAEKLAGSGIGVRVHVVGFDIPEKDRAQLECIAERGGGRYFAANSTESFAEAVTEAVQVAQVEEPPAPSGPVRERVFFDDFDGEDLSEDWLVNNPDPDGYIVENGVLLIVDTKPGGFASPDGANMMQLEAELPEGDWDIHVKFDGQFKTLRDMVQVGLRDDEQNYLFAGVYSTSWNTGSSSSGDNAGTIVLTLRRASGGEITEFEKNVLASNSIDDARAFNRNIRLTLSKRGRSYTATYQADGEVDENGNQISYTTDSLTMLRPPRSLMLSASKWGESNGEFQANIDSVEIEKVTEAQ